MFAQYRFTVGALARLMDVTIVGAVWLLSFWLRFHVPIIQVTKGFPPFSNYAALTPLVVVLWTIALEMQGIYRTQGLARQRDEVLMLIKAHGAALLCFTALTYAFSEYRYSRGVLIYFGVLGAVSLLLSRPALHAVLRLVHRKGIRTRNVLLIGQGRPLDLLIERISSFPELGWKIAGVLIPEGVDATSIAGHPVLGHLDDTQRALRETQAQGVVVALGRQRWADLERVLASIQDETVDIQVVPDVHEFATLGCAVEDFDGLPLVSLNESRLLGWRAIMKRITDVVFSALALTLGAPVFAIIAAAVKLTSPGPIFYGQERVGLDGRRFKMYKFRSMRVDAEAASGAVWAKAGDDRRTPIGALLRATSLDEIPQFWNVLVGHMSLVGPRPERPMFVDQFRGQISHYMLRHRVKAGVTGWAQVNGWRGDTSLDERILCDLYYIRHWSYLFDLKILFLTVWKGFVNKNAY